MQDSNGLEVHWLIDVAGTFGMQWCVALIVRCVDVSVIVQKELAGEEKRLEGVGVVETDFDYFQGSRTMKRSFTLIISRIDIHS